MERFFYFKVTFLFFTAGIFVGLLFYGLFDIDFSDGQAILTLFLQSFTVAIVTGLILGLLNMMFKIGNFPNWKK